MRKSIKAKTPKNSFPITKELPLEFMVYSENRKQLYSAMFKRWHDDCAVAKVPLVYQQIAQEEEELDTQDFQLVAQIMRIHDSFRDIGIACTISQAYKVHKKYWVKRIIPWVVKKVKKRQGVWPTMKKTETARELIMRGWVHPDEAKHKKGEVWLYAHDFPLVWPQSYYLHQDAIDILNKVGIPGRTGTRRPKE